MNEDNLHFSGAQFHDVWQQFLDAIAPHGDRHPSPRGKPITELTGVSQRSRFIIGSEYLSLELNRRLEAAGFKEKEMAFITPLKGIPTRFQDLPTIEIKYGLPTVEALAHIKRSAK